MSLLNLDNINEDKIVSLLRSAIEFKNGKQVSYNFDKVLVNLFFEDSTRTHYSFSMAAKRLKIQTIEFSPSSSSLNKGESFIDTIDTFRSFKPDIMVIRDSKNRYYDEFDLEIPIINGGDGNYSHPTQSLLDLMTIYEQFGYFAGLRVILCGDIKHSRVARTNYKIMKKLKMEVSLCAPSYLQDEYGSYYEIDNIIDKCDVIMMLRMQIERHPEVIDIKDFNQKYGLNKNRLNKLSKESIIMHPAPFNRGVEVDDDVIEDSRCKIFTQSENGVYLRMAVINDELK